MRISPLSGFSWPMIMRNSVVLPVPFGPMMPTMPPAGRRNDKSSIKQPVAVALVECLGLDDQFAQRLAGRDLNLQLVLALLESLRGHLLVGFDAGLVLRLPCARRHANPFQLALERFLPSRGLFFLACEPLALLLQPRRVVALPRNAASAVELQNPPGDVVEKIAIVRHRHDGARILGQVVLEPGHAFGVEMVGRLVEQQKVRPLEQHLAQRHPPPLAAGELRRRRRRPAEGSSRPSRSRLAGPAPRRS